MFCCYLAQLERGAVSTWRITAKEEKAATKGTVGTKKCELSPTVTLPCLSSSFRMFLWFFADEEENSIQSQLNVTLKAPSSTDKT